MQRTRIATVARIFAAGIICCSVGCASDEPLLTPPKNILYERTLQADKLAITEAAQYFRRTVVRIASDSIPAGVYLPSEVHQYRDQCESSFNPSPLFGTRIGLTTTGSHATPLLDAAIPPELSWSEIQRITAERPWGELPGPPQNPRPKFLECGLEASLDERRCSKSLATWPQETAESLRVKDLDFIFLVEETSVQTCRRLRSVDLNGTRRPDHDLSRMKAQKQENERKADLAASFYDASGMMELVKLLPLKHREGTDKGLGLPPRLNEQVRGTFASAVDSLQEYFYKNVPPRPSLTFDRDALGLRLVDYGAWFQALTPLSGTTIYVSPLLARAPFYMCYSHVYRYLENRARLMQKLINDDTRAWKDMTAADVMALANSQKDIDKTYRECTDAQLRFVVAHELGHLVDNDASDDLSELLADCFALIFTKRVGAFDLELFDSLILSGVGAAKQPLTDLRRRNLSRLEKQLAAEGLPPNGESAVVTCRRLTIPHQ